MLPAVRREIAKYLINTKNLSRKIVAGKLGLTEAAVCQYLKHKRGGTHQFNDHDLVKIREMADIMMTSEKGFDKMCVVCKEFDASDQILAQNSVKRIESRL